MATLPYGIATKLIPIAGLLRSDLSKPLEFANAKAENCGIIYRRSSVVKLKANLPPPAEYSLLGRASAEDLGVYPNDARVKEFLEIRPDDASFLKFIFEFANTFTIRESSGITDGYARGWVRNYVVQIALIVRPGSDPCYRRYLEAAYTRRDRDSENPDPTAERRTCNRRDRPQRRGD